jgi:probable F420-dependent oxidoreductase
MKFGAPFIGALATQDRVAIRDYVQAVEEMGYDYLMMDEVLLNDNPKEIFHESLTLFAYLCGFTKKLKLVTGVMILPKRSTLLVARQTAEVDLLSGGRLRLGVGVGWSEREFQALGIDFRSRGKRIEEQITLLRKLWTEPAVTFKGDYHHIENVGINLLPVQRPIPIWMGGAADVVLRRTARMADGWMAVLTSPPEFRQIVNKLVGYLEVYGRDKQSFRLINYLHLGQIPEAEWAQVLAEWHEIGVTHVGVLATSGWDAGLSNMEATLQELRRFMTFTQTLSALQPA